MERLVWKKKRGERGREKFGLVSDPSRKHSSEGVWLFEGDGAVPLQAPQTGHVAALLPGRRDARMLAWFSYSNFTMNKQTSLSGPNALNHPYTGLLLG